MNAFRKAAAMSSPMPPRGPMIVSDHLFDTDSDFHGMIRGNVTIASGRNVTLRGMVGGNITVQPGASLALPGMTLGDVTVEQGGHVWLSGMVRGQVINQGGAVDYAARPSGD